MDSQTLHHRISRQHLPYYLDEFTFRFSREDLPSSGTRVLISA
jgi:hypothetical protein